MTTPYEAAHVASCIKKAESHGFKLEFHMDTIKLGPGPKTSAICFPCIEELWGFLCGYEWGYSDGRLAVWSAQKRTPKKCTPRDNSDHYPDELNH